MYRNCAKSNDSSDLDIFYKGPFKNNVDKMRGKGSENVCFCEMLKKWQNSVQLFHIGRHID